MNQALSIPELLDIIFSFVNRDSNVNNARVCKQWSDIALDALWCEVEDFLALFNILAPIRKGPRNYSFSRTPDFEDWTRFTRYARRVRRLRIKGRAEGHYRSIFDTVAVTRTSLILCPNLHTLECIAGPESFIFRYFALFMHESVKRLIINIPYKTGDRCSRLIEDITSRMPYLTELDLRPHTPMESVQSNIIELLQRLPELTKVVFPNHYLTGPIVEALSRMENVKVILIQSEHDERKGNSADVENFSPVLADGAFPSLWGLSLSANLADAVRFFQQSFAPINLTMLHIGPTTFQRPNMLKEFLVVVSNNCQMLQKLVLVLLEITEPRLSSVGDEVIDSETLRPLMDCNNLTCFELTHEYPVKMSLEELEEFARNWPSLEVLLLNCEPIAIQTPTLGLSAFLPFAEHCPNIRHLGLFIYASADDLPSLKDRKMFKNLQKLSMGVSDISDEGKVALFLGKLCPTIKEVKCGVTWLDLLGNGAQSLAVEVGRRCEKWKEVQLLPFIAQMCLEERERSRALTLEVEDFEARIQVLMETRYIQQLDHGCIIS